MDSQIKSAQSEYQDQEIGIKLSNSKIPSSEKVKTNFSLKIVEFFLWIIWLSSLPGMVDLVDILLIEENKEYNIIPKHYVKITSLQKDFSQG